MFKRIVEFWLDITNQTDKNGFNKGMRKEKRKLDKLHKKAKKNKK